MEKSLVLFLLLLNVLIVVYGEIRCYCNESGCVRTGYMCKSERNSCYTVVTVKNEANEFIHGCSESLSAEYTKSCSSGGNVIRENRDIYPQATPRIYVTCCGDDMCNYKDAIDINIVVGSKKANVSASDDAHVNKPSEDTPSPGPYDRHIWFKAAVIAVPISGGCILVILILLAVRMLRTDSRRHRQLMDNRYKQAYANSYVAQHFCDNPEKKTNLHTRLLNQCDCMRPGCAQREVYGNVVKGTQLEFTQHKPQSDVLCLNSCNASHICVNKSKCRLNGWCRYCQTDRRRFMKCNLYNKTDMNSVWHPANVIGAPMETTLFLCKDSAPNIDPAPV